MTYRLDLTLPVASEQELERKASLLFGRFLRCVGRRHIDRFGLRFEDVHRHVGKSYGVKLIEGQKLGSDRGCKILGVYQPWSNTAEIDECIGPSSDDPRRVFTLYHEVFGHGVLQGRWMREQMQEAVSNKLIVTEDSFSVGTERRAEWQANRFGAAVAAPKTLVSAAIMLHFNGPVVYRGGSMYWLPSGNGSRPVAVGSYEHLCTIVAAIIQPHFGGLSVTALSKRVAKCYLVPPPVVPDFRMLRRA